MEVILEFNFKDGVIILLDRGRISFFYRKRVIYMYDIFSEWVVFLCN